jgi:hypothetical protein
MAENYVQTKRDLSMGSDQLEEYDLASQNYRSYQTPLAEANV